MAEPMSVTAGESTYADLISGGNILRRMNGAYVIDVEEVESLNKVPKLSSEPAKN
jgi:hypothetical protein